MDIKYEINDDCIVYNNEGLVIVFTDEEERNNFKNIIHSLDETKQKMFVELAIKDKLKKTRKFLAGFSFVGTIIMSACLLFETLTAMGIFFAFITATSLIEVINSDNEIKELDKKISYLNKKRVILHNELESLCEENNKKISDQPVARYVSLNSKEKSNREDIVNVENIDTLTTNKILVKKKTLK